MLLSTSYLSIKNDLENKLIKLDKTSTDYIHVDVMDGKFVPNETLKFNELYLIFNRLNKPFDVHLMVDDVYSYIDEYTKINPEYITFHLEVKQEIDNLIEYIKNKNIKVGISIKPNTSINELIPYLDKIDLVLVMSVEPGKGGQAFIKNSTDKINELNKIRKNNNYNYVIEVDGGINNDTIDYAQNADIVVSGSFITNSDNYEKRIEQLLCRNGGSYEN